MSTSKRVLAGLLALLVALCGGWLWGVSGKRELDRTVQTLAVRSDLLEARGAVLEARVHLYNVNFGNASRALEHARTVLGRVGARLRDAGSPDEAKGLDLALAKIGEAQQFTNQLDQTANSRAADAVTTIESVLGTVTN